MTELSYSFNERRLCGKSSPRVLWCSQDTVVVVFSLASGKLVYASEQASSVLHCKRKFLESAKFVELLYHQDVNVFYSHTAQLLPWNVGSDSGEKLSLILHIHWIMQTALINSTVHLRMKDVVPLCLCVAAVLFERAQVKSFFCRIRSVCFILSELHLVQHYYSFSSDMIINISHLFK